MVSAPGGISQSLSPGQNIRFRPDPGEPAVRLSAPPQQTALLVSYQEQRNETRLRNRAVAEGNDVVFSKRTFTLGVGQGSPVYNGGLTTVYFREDPNGVLPNQNATAVQGEKNRITSAPEEDQAASNDNPPASMQEAVRPSPDELKAEAQELDNEDARLSRNLTGAVLEQNLAMQNGDTIEAQQAQRKMNQLARDLSDLNEEQRKNELDQLEARMQDALNSPTGDVLNTTPNNAPSASDILGVLFGLPAGQTQPSPA